MNFINEVIRIFITLVAVSLFSIYTHFALTLWQILPIKEECSTPIYITKEL